MRRRLFKNLVSEPCTEPWSPQPPAELEKAGAALRGAVARRLGRSLAIRAVDAGSCNGCELEIHALNNAFYDIERCHLRDPSWFQWPLLEAAIEGNIVADFPLCNKSFNCSYSGHDL